MNTTKETLKGNWNVIKGRLKQEYGNLTDDDLAYIEGREDELIGQIEQKTGKAKDEIISFIKNI